MNQLLTVLRRKNNNNNNNKNMNSMNNNKLSGSRTRTAVASHFNMLTAALFMLSIGTMIITTTTTAFVVVNSSTKMNPLFPSSSHQQQRQQQQRLPQSFGAIPIDSSFSSSSLSAKLDDDKNLDNSNNKIKIKKNQLLGFLLTVTIAMTAGIGGIGVEPANAGFGAPGGATSSITPNLQSIEKTASKVKKTAGSSSSQSSQSSQSSPENFDLDGKKLKLLINSALDRGRLQEFSSQLDVLIENLKIDLPFQKETESETTEPFFPPDATTEAATQYWVDKREEAILKRAERLHEIEKVENLQQQIQHQELMLTKLQNQPYWFNYIAAFVGSAISTLIMHPIDTIKTRLQIAVSNITSTAATAVLEQPRVVVYEEDEMATTMVSSATATTTMKEVVATPATAHSAKTTALTSTSTTSTTETNDGGGLYDDLYEGLTGNLWKEVPPSAVYLGVYETVKYALAPKVAPIYLLFVYLIAGAAGETVGSVIRAPAEAVKSLVQSKAKNNAWEACQSVLGTPEGRANVVRAWSSSITRDVPFGAIQLAVFEVIKAYILNNPDIEFDSSTLLSEAIIGAFAGGLGSFLTNPTDVITTRIITQDVTTTPTYDDDGVMIDDGENNAPLDVFEMGRKIYNEEGFDAFFTGWTARVGYWAPAISIFLTCYCSVRQAGITYDLFP
ncbi:mitochondrial carrier [Fragilariopsis cylindrus CCMP1102]|uniref:Mitochondrial carrier n=1 Tax=Fragilariopsis cylindrus CCMP1102 TaxID=635003 RepID=A0A1E7F3X1_9STRA|nr:mitochondrial carrier [Fragilariopsis cylindrus CCMP1102]|eukprot:OEU12839.1 mitochondrial carrier [Fragilariopsis cylindrus CCMP1102]